MVYAHCAMAMPGPETALGELSVTYSKLAVGDDTPEELLGISTVSLQNWGLTLSGSKTNCH